jgi:hypothetical protein
LRIRFARSATKHRVSRNRSRFVVEQCRLILCIPSRKPVEDEVFLLFLGDDPAGTALEVIAVERTDGSLYVIHAMPLRERYRAEYEEVKRWRA